MTAELCLDLFWPDGTPRSQQNAFCWRTRPPSIDMSEESTNQRSGANAAATKRARGQELIPKLHLKGSQPKTVWRPAVSTEELPVCTCSRKPCAPRCTGEATNAVSTV